jgi:hypothetical protein
MINLPVDRWTAVEPGAGELTELILPKELV